MNFALYEAENKAAAEAYRRRGCPDCGDIAVDVWGRTGRDGQHCQLHTIANRGAA